MVGTNHVLSIFNSDKTSVKNMIDTVYNNWFDLRFFFFNKFSMNAFELRFNDDKERQY